MVTFFFPFFSLVRRQLQRVRWRSPSTSFYRCRSDGTTAALCLCVPVVFSIPLGGGALDAGNPQVGQALSFLYGAKIGRGPHFDHGLCSRANPRVVSDGFDSADSKFMAVNPKHCLALLLLLMPYENIFRIRISLSMKRA